jgi:hypothetical protein
VVREDRLGVAHEPELVPDLVRQPRHHAPHRRQPLRRDQPLARRLELAHALGQLAARPTLLEPLPHLHDQLRRVPGLLHVLPDADLVDGADRALLVGVAREDHPHRVGMARANALEEGDPVERRHLQIGEHHVGRRRLHARER